jgi:hypothetical protein
MVAAAAGGGGGGAMGGLMGGPTPSLHHQQQQQGRDLLHTLVGGYFLIASDALGRVTLGHPVRSSLQALGSAGLQALALPLLVVLEVTESTAAAVRVLLAERVSAGSLRVPRYVAQGVLLQQYDRLDSTGRALLQHLPQGWLRQGGFLGCAELGPGVFGVVTRQRLLLLRCGLLPHSGLQFREPSVEMLIEVADVAGLKVTGRELHVLQLGGGSGAMSDWSAALGLLPRRSRPSQQQQQQEGEEGQEEARQASAAAVVGREQRGASSQDEQQAVGATVGAAGAAASSSSGGNSSSYLARTEQFDHGAARRAFDSVPRVDQVTLGLPSPRGVGLQVAGPAEGGYINERQEQADGAEGAAAGEEGSGAVTSSSSSGTAPAWAAAAARSKVDRLVKPLPKWFCSTTLYCSSHEGAAELQRLLHVACQQWEVMVAASTQWQRQRLL